MKFLNDLSRTVLTVVAAAILVIVFLQIAPNYFPDFFGKEEPAPLVNLLPEATPTVDAVVWVVSELHDELELVTAEAGVLSGGIATCKQGLAELQVGVVISGTLQMGVNLSSVGTDAFSLRGGTLTMYVPETPKVKEFVYLGDIAEPQANKTLGQLLTGGDARHLHPELVEVARNCAIYKICSDTGIGSPDSLFARGCPADVRHLEMAEYGVDQRVAGLAEALTYARQSTRRQLGDFLCALSGDERARWQEVKVVFPLEDPNAVEAVSCQGGEDVPATQ